MRKKTHNRFINGACPKDSTRKVSGNVEFRANARLLKRENINEGYEGCLNFRGTRYFKPG